MRLRRSSDVPSRIAAIFLALLPGCFGPALFNSQPLSWGTPNLGGQVSATQFPDRGEGFVRSRPGDATRYGVLRLVNAIQRAATDVHQRLGGTLRVGDIASRTGGSHQRHHSHQSGRDIDVSFYVVDASGAAAMPGTFAFSHVGEQADQTETRYHFDVMRNWFFLRALLGDPSLDLQWVFCSNGVKAQLLDYALSIETDSALLLRAAYTLHQPTTGNPHDDHFHIRVFCTADEMDSGCLDSEPVWPWSRRRLVTERASGELSEREAVDLLLGEEFIEPAGGSEQLGQ